MSIHVWNCRCGRRWFGFGRSQWDSNDGVTAGCPGCFPGIAHGAGWREL